MGFGFLLCGCFCFCWFLVELISFRLWVVVFLRFSWKKDWIFICCFQCLNCGLAHAW